MTEFQEFLKTYIEENNVSTREIAEMTGYTEYHIYCLLTGRSMPSYGSMVTIIGVLGYELKFEKREEKDEN